MEKQTKQRERLGSRLGFILLSAGCAIGLGNVYRFPIITGAYGGAIFVLIYIAFLLLLGIPVMTMELAVGRASQRSIATSFDMLEKPKQKWHLIKYLGVAGNYLLMMFYTCISGWMFVYFFKYLTGAMDGVGTTTAELSGVFGEMLGNTGLMVGLTIAVIVVCFGICAIGLQKGVERVTKVMMLMLFALMLGLAIYSLTLSGAGEGLGFYLIPSIDRINEAGLFTIITAAMGQAFFTLSLGIGSIGIFGSYINKERRLLGEACTIVSLDTSVALISGLIVFPACFTYNGGVTASPDTVGAGFLFTTLSSMFNNMPGGRIIGTLFFLFMIFASLSTVIAVFENITSFWLETTKLKRWQISIINILLISALSMPAVLSLNVLSDIEILGMGFLDLEDFAVSNIILPLGCLIHVLFCTSKFGWGWDNYLSEVNLGKKGMKVPKGMRIYLTYILPLIILALLIISNVMKFI